MNKLTQGGWVSFYPDETIVTIEHYAYCNLVYMNVGFCFIIGAFGRATLKNNIFAFLKDLT